MTGGAGYVGSALVPLLLAAGHEVRVLDNLIYGPGGLAALPAGEVGLLEGDVAAPADLARALEGVAAVAHLAGTSGDPSCDLDPEACRRDNETGTARLAEACAERGIQRVAFASSCSVYGAQDATVDEDATPRPLTLYAETKLAGEGAIAALEEGASLRLSTLFGAAGRTRCDLVVNLFTCQAVDRGRLVLFGGRQWRPLLHVRDAARAFLLALTLPAAKVGGVFNVGGDHLNMRVSEIAAEVQKRIAGTTVSVHPVDEDARSYRVAFGRIRERWGFVPELSVGDGVEEMRAALAGGSIADWRHPVCSTRGRVLR